jgi:hypothetical protein
MWCWHYRDLQTWLIYVENKTRKGNLVSQNKNKEDGSSGARDHGEMIHWHTTFQGDDKPLTKTNYHVIE